MIKEPKIAKIPSIYIEKDIEMFKLRNNIYAISNKTKAISIHSLHFDSRICLTMEDIKALYDHLIEKMGGK